MSVIEKYPSKAAVIETERISAIESQYNRIKNALIEAHNFTYEIERKIDKIYSVPKESKNEDNKAAGNPQTFYEAMCQLADVSESLEAKLRAAYKNFQEAI